MLPSLQNEPISKSVFFKTFGCQMNVYDSDRMAAQLKGKGYASAPSLGEADVIIINTCSIRDKSEHKVLSLLGQLKPLKDKNPDKVIGIAGCVGQRMGRELLQRVPHLDLVFGPDSIGRVDELIEQAAGLGKRVVETKFDVAGREYSQPAHPVGNSKPSEYLTIIKGCDHFCTYCIVPFVRGREKSRPIEEVLQDVRNLVEGGTREVVFLGQNINTYGKGTDYTLAELIDRTNSIDGISRIRYVTSHPRDLGSDLIEQFGAVEKLCPQLHLPFQSGSNRILKRMSRLYDRATYMEKITALRKACPDIALSTDVIVGFPGETEEDFLQTMEVLEEIGFSQAYLFKYSPRPGTRAFSTVEEQVPEIVKEERLKRAQDLTVAYIEAENRALEGTVVEVLIESIDRKGMYFTGRTRHSKIVHVLNAGEACLGKQIPVEITQSTGNSLKGYFTGAPRIDREQNG